MDQSKSSSLNEAAVTPASIPIPRRSFSVEFFVGVFTLLGVLATGYLAMGLGDLKIGSSNTYTVYAEFDNVSGLQYGASVEIAGVPVGEVTAINLDDSVAVVTLNVDKSVRLRDDDIASIRTKGIIGDRYLKISRGASEIFVPENGRLTETESVVDIEDIIGKIVHSLSGTKDEPADEEPTEAAADEADASVE